MAKVMVMVDIPNYDYDELKKLMENYRASTVPAVVFGFRHVLIHERYLGPKHEGGFRRFELIGVKP